MSGQFSWRKQPPACFLDCPMESSSLQGFTLLSSRGCHLSNQCMSVVPQQEWKDGSVLVESKSKGTAF